MLKKCHPTDLYFYDHFHLLHASGFKVQGHLQQENWREILIIRSCKQVNRNKSKPFFLTLNTASDSENDSFRLDIIVCGVQAFDIIYSVYNYVTLIIAFE